MIRKELAAGRNLDKVFWQDVNISLADFLNRVADNLFPGIQVASKTTKVKRSRKH
jgi:hypothetical protein